MKNINYAFVLLTVGVLFFSSCSPQLTPFTKRLQEDNNWSEQDLKRIQFYLSEDIVLQKQRKNGETRIESGEIKIVDDARVEEIIVRRGTPGVLSYYPREDRLGICFEEGDDGRYLMFGPNPKQGNRYALLASDWTRRKGKVSYGEEKYYTTSESAYAALLVNLKKVRRTKVKSHTAGGRKVD